MKASSHDFVTVDMRGLKTALVERAHQDRLSVSALVRQCVERALDVHPEPQPETTESATVPRGPLVKLSIRMTGSEADWLDGGARRAGVSRGAFLAGLLAGVPSFSGAAGNRLECLATLTASTAELSTLTRNVHQLTALLRRAEVQPAQAYRRMLDTLEHDVRVHLRLAASVLAELRPARQSGGPVESRTSSAFD
jgi:hypothetical protein